MAIAQVGAVTSGSQAGSGASATKSVTTGNGILCATYWQEAGNPNRTVTSVTCTNESNLTLIGSPIRNVAASNTAVQLCYLSNIGTGESKTLQVTLSGTVDTSGIAFIEVSGQNTTDVYDTGMTRAEETYDEQVDDTPSFEFTSITANAAGFGFLLKGASTTNAADTSWTVTDISDLNTLNSWLLFKPDLGAAGAKSATVTITAYGQLIAVVASFKPAGGSGVVNARNGIALSGISAINGITKSTLSHINGLTI